MVYSENLKKIRKQMDISAAKLAKQLGVSQGSIAQYEAGTRKPDYNFISHLNKILNINLNWFVTGIGEMFIEKQPANLKEEIKQTVLELVKNGDLTINDFK